MVGSLGGAFVLLAVVLLVAVALAVLVILVTAAGRDEDPVVAAADGPGLLARRDGGARARQRFERAEQLVLRGVRVLVPRRAHTAASAAPASPRPAATPAPGPGRAVAARASRSTPGTSAGPALPATTERRTEAPRPAVARATGAAPSRVDLTAVEGGTANLGALERRERAEVDLRAPTALPGVVQGSGDQDASDQVLAGAVGREAGRGRPGRRPQLPPVVHRVTERLVARVFDPFGSSDGSDSSGSSRTAGPTPATSAAPAAPAERSVEGGAPLRSAGPR